MKKILLIIVAFFYLGTFSGATVHFHYCMGELVKWSLTTPADGNCEFCGMSKNEVKKNSCCKDDYKQAKLDAGKKTSQTVYQFNSAVELADYIFKNNADHVVLPAKVIRSVYGNAPPEKERIPIFIRNCTYRI